MPDPYIMNDSISTAIYGGLLLVGLGVMFWWMLREISKIGKKK